jgi:hypothetical protein
MWTQSFIKACDLTVLINVLVMLFLYIRALFAMRNDGERSFARNLCLGIVVGWAGSAVLYGNLAFVYWLKEASVMLSPASTTVRMVYITLTLTGCIMHIATSFATGGHWWRTLLLWAAITWLFIFAVTVIDVHGLV